MLFSLSLLFLSFTLFSFFVSLPKGFLQQAISVGDRVFKFTPFAKANNSTKRVTYSQQPAIRQSALLAVQAQIKASRAGIIFVINKYEADGAVGVRAREREREVDKLFILGHCRRVFSF